MRWRPMQRAVTTCCALVLVLGGGTMPSLVPVSAAQPATQQLPMARTDRITALAYSPDGTTLASASWDGTITLWDINSGQPRRTLAGHVGPVNGVAFSPDGTLLASVGQDTVLRIWDVATGDQRLKLTGHAEPILTVAFSPDGTTVATGGQDTWVILWDVAAG